ncbi:MAG TPA: hypothetical protein VFK52_12165 [Nocardioidaceae bacterium]|nr:hypothetical protein [Nocardioidaceae bacterium]
MRRTLTVVPALVLSLGALTGCGDDDPATSGETPTPTTTSVTPTETTTTTPTPTEDPGVVIEATIRGEELDPNGERVEVPLGEPITIVVDADHAGELHVHSDPEQELAYQKGTTRLEIAPITVPGIIEVEDHGADKLLVSLLVQ